MFHGFSKELIPFWLELPLNNTIAALPDNKRRYDEIVGKPLRELFETLVPVISEISPELEVKPSRCISSPYTDRRFSHDMPLKEYVYLRFRLMNRESDAVGFYFDMGLSHYGYGLRVYNSTADGMQVLREKLIVRFSEAEKSLSNAEKHRFHAVDKLYKKDHFPALPDGAVKSVLNRKSFYLEKTVPVGETVFSHALADELSDGFMKLKPLFELIR
ncbi:MAG TPA: DUF2461 family protein [Oscillospiraceae bacterium]|nr:DUF2461 family protein [Oscillospiraceae bacterium]HPF56110.1 DUF2461 family protein [Clostridiales bacterium]HPK34356.1 DUF2461 family protein [Oscillospiraceae bacterium]HPR75135.1 DUF2461 family protein [Oscillospiraceae bacterium]